MSRELSEVNAELRQKFMDGDEPFATGHGIRKPRRTYTNKRIPIWAKDDREVKKLLLSVFPLSALPLKEQTPAGMRQRARAGIWIRVIQLYFRTNFSQSDAAYEAKMSINQLKETVRRIRNAHEGFWSNGRKRRGLRKTGRPRKRVLWVEPKRHDIHRHGKVGRLPVKQNQVRKWLLDYLKMNTTPGSRDIAAATVKTAAIRNQIPLRTLARVKKALRIRSEKRGDNRTGNQRGFWIIAHLGILNATP